jgi:hypothetical protein
MKHIVWKAYWDYEKEEQWINEMSQKGLALIDYTWCRYVFEDTPKGKYTYRIELLDNLMGHPKSREYIRFLEETGIEHVTHYMRWAYFRQETAKGPFELYTDIESRLAYYEKVNKFWMFFAVLEFSVGIFNVITGLGIHGTSSSGSTNVFLGSMLIALGFVFLKLGSPLRQKIRTLKMERSLNE